MAPCVRLSYVCRVNTEADSPAGRSATAEPDGRHGTEDPALDQIRRSWETYARIDPMWAILTEDDKRHNAWSAESFFATGRQDVDRFLDQIRSAVGADWTPAGKCALDFGCGIGRLSQALAQHFADVVGTDISATMIDQATKLNRFGQRCRYVVNDTDDLSQFGDDTFDFVLAWIVLQHMEPRLAHGYLRELLRTLHPNGLLLFQLPHQRRDHSGEQLPDSALRASLTIRHAPVRLRTNEKSDVAVTVVNRGDVSWPDHFVEKPLRCGNHWRMPSGEDAAQDDGRTRLPHPVAPGEAVDLQVTVTAPPSPGHYDLVIDMVHEGVAWFEALGGAVARRRITVRPARRWFGRKSRPPTPLGRDDPRLRDAVMQMHTTAIPEVEGIVKDAGGKILAEITWSNDSFHDVEYVVRKR